MNFRLQPIESQGVKSGRKAKEERNESNARLKAVQEAKKRTAGEAKNKMKQIPMPYNLEQRAKIVKLQSKARTINFAKTDVEKYAALDRKVQSRKSKIKTKASNRRSRISNKSIYSSRKSHIPTTEEIYAARKAQDKKLAELRAERAKYKDSVTPKSKPRTVQQIQQSKQEVGRPKLRHVDVPQSSGGGMKNAKPSGAILDDALDELNQPLKKGKTTPLRGAETGGRPPSGQKVLQNPTFHKPGSQVMRPDGSFAIYDPDHLPRVKRNWKDRSGRPKPMKRTVTGLTKKKPTLRARAYGKRGRLIAAGGVLATAGTAIPLGIAAGKNRDKEHLHKRNVRKVHGRTKKEQVQLQRRMRLIDFSTIQRKGQEVVIRNGKQYIRTKTGKLRSR